MRRLGWKLLFLILLAGIVFVWLVKATLLSSYLTNQLRVPVSIEWIGIWPSKTNIRNFKIKNPKGFKTRVAFEAKSTAIDYELKELFGNPTVIESIDIDTIFLGVEFSNP